MNSRSMIYKLVGVVALVAIFGPCGLSHAFSLPVQSSGTLTKNGDRFGGLLSGFHNGVHVIPKAAHNRGSAVTRLFAEILEPPAKEKVDEEVEKKDAAKEKESYSKKGGWAVRLFNDPMNKREFVAMCLSKIVGLTDGQAYQVMMQAHQNGVAVVGRFDFERAELYRNSLQENGLMVDMIEVED